MEIFDDQHDHPDNCDRSMIDVLWAEYPLMEEGGFFIDEAYFLWETNPEFRAEIREIYRQLMKIDMEIAEFLAPSSKG